MTGGSIDAKEFVLIDYLQWIELLSSLEMSSSIKTVFAVLFAWAVMPSFATRPSYVDITWMSIANMYYEIGNIGILTDGYFTRIPQDAFYGGGGGLAHTRMAYKPDVDAVTRVLEALGGKQR